MRKKMMIFALLLTATMLLAGLSVTSQAAPCRLICACDTYTTSQVGWDNTNVIGLAEFAMFAATYNNPQAYDPSFDFNCDGEVGLVDFAFVVSHFGHQ